MARSTLIAAGSTPQVTDLWAMPYLFSADWGDEVSVRSGFSTSIEHASSAAEQRRGLMGSPRRVVTFSLSGFTREQINALQSLLFRGSKARALVPLICDMAYLTASAAATATTLNVTTTYRRFSTGTRAVIFEPTSNPQITTFEVVSVDGVTASTLTVSALVNNYSSLAVVVPLIEAHARFAGTGEFHTDQAASVVLEATEVVGTTQLPGTATLGSIPAEFASFDSLPIYDLPVNFRDTVGFGVSRYGSLISSGIGAIEVAEGERGAATFSLPFMGVTRAEAWEAIRLFDSRGGRLYPFFMLNPATEFTVVSVVGGGTGIVLEAMGAEYDWNFRPYIGLEKSDGTLVVRDIASVVRTGDEDTITFGSSVAALVAGDIVRATSARKVRFSSDEMSEQWSTDGVLISSMELIEVPEDKSVTVSDLTNLTSSDLLAEFDATLCVDNDPDLQPVPGDCADVRDPSALGIEGWNDDEAGFWGDSVRVFMDGVCNAPDATYPALPVDDGILDVHTPGTCQWDTPASLQRYTDANGNQWQTNKQVFIAGGQYNLACLFRRTANFTGMPVNEATVRYRKTLGLGPGGVYELDPAQPNNARFEEVGCFVIRPTVTLYEIP